MLPAVSSPPPPSPPKSTPPIAYSTSPSSRALSSHVSWAQMPRFPPPAAPRSLLARACLLLLIFLSADAADAGPLTKELLHPDFSASSYDHIDNNGGAFLESTNGAFRAAIHNPGKQQASFYLAVLHAATGTPVWSANRDTPTGPSGRVQLTARGLAVTDADGTTVLWSASPRAPVAALRLRDDGNLQLLDAGNKTLWQSFDGPTDTLLPGQPLHVGSYLTSGRSSSDFGQGDYRLAVAASDVALTWHGSTYWRLSNDRRSFKDHNAAAASMSFNASGLFLLADDGTLVFRVVLPTAEFRVLTLGPDGRLSIRSYALLNSSAPVGGDFVAPDTACELPLPCASLGLCAQAANSSSCTCPPLFATSVTDAGTCTPGDGSLLASPASCGSNGSASTSVSYLPLAAKIAYFATSFDAPTTTGVNHTACRALCTANCTCLGYFHDNSSMRCNVLGGRQLGSLHWATRATSALGYIKTFNSATRASKNKHNSSSIKRLLPIVLPSVASLLLLAVVAWYLLRRRWKASKNGKKAKSKNSAGNQLNYLGHQNMRSRDTRHNDDPDDDGDIVIPGMPARFSYAEITSMTANFGTKIGSGGFGSVYRGELPGGEGLVAVKKLEAVGVQAKREFCTEIAVIGNIRHVNLVRLRGFCAEGSRRLLVYEYMDRSSLDRTLFGGIGPALEWGERMEVAVGAARGLAYLHTGCDQKIVHCDVKPENILLAHGGQVKVSDFGLAKLMSSEHSAIFTTMRGTRGYLAPEWLSNAAISDRADVYSFGMVLLELVRGRKNRGEQEQEQGGAVDGDGSGEHSAFPSPSGYSSMMTSSTASVGGTGAGGGDEYFPMVALELHEQGRYLDLVDPRVEGRVSEADVARVVTLALCCLHEDPAQRPSMDAVVRVLEGSAAPPEPRVGALGFLRLYGRGHAMPAQATPATTAGSAGWSAASTTAGSQLNDSLRDTSLPR